MNNKTAFLWTEIIAVIVATGAIFLISRLNITQTVFGALLLGGSLYIIYSSLEWFIYDAVSRRQQQQQKSALHLLLVASVVLLIVAAIVGFNASFIFESFPINIGSFVNNPQLQEMTILKNQTIHWRTQIDDPDNVLVRLLHLKFGFLVTNKNTGLSNLFGHQLETILHELQFMTICTHFVQTYTTLPDFTAYVQYSPNQNSNVETTNIQAEFLAICKATLIGQKKADNNSTIVLQTAYYGNINQIISAYMSRKAEAQYFSEWILDIVLFEFPLLQDDKAVFTFGHIITAIINNMTQTQLAPHDLQQLDNILDSKDSKARTAALNSFLDTQSWRLSAQKQQVDHTVFLKWFEYEQHKHEALKKKNVNITLYLRLYDIVRQFSSRLKKSKK